MRQDCLILFRSLTHAQRAAHILERSGMTATVRKAPQGLTDRGCSYCVRLRADRLSGALTLLGSGLHVSHLSLEEGQLLVEGEISALEYDSAPRARGSWLSRLAR